MAAIPKKVSERLVSGIKRYQPILAAAKARDVGEADTVTIIKDMLADVFGYDKYSDVTSEHSIRGTYCDLAIKIDNQLQTLIEVKAIDIDLKDQHVKQAIDYAANQGVDWVLLTNGIVWRVYHLIFAKPIDQELVLEIDFCKLNAPKRFRHRAVVSLVQGRLAALRARRVPHAEAGLVPLFRGRNAPDRNRAGCDPSRVYGGSRRTCASTPHRFVMSLSMKSSSAKCSKAKRPTRQEKDRAFCKQVVAIDANQGRKARGTRRREGRCRRIALSKCRSAALGS
jgi:hypothetical protein